MSSKINVGTVALRDLAGGAGRAGDGPVDVTTRMRDFGVVRMLDPNGKEVAMPADSLVTFTAASFRELLVDGEPSGIFEFVQMQPTKPGAPPARSRIYLAGEDIFSVKVMSQLV